MVKVIRGSESGFASDNYHVCLCVCVCVCVCGCVGVCIWDRDRHVCKVGLCQNRLVCVCVCVCV